MQQSASYKLCKIIWVLLKKNYAHIITQQLLLKPDYSGFLFFQELTSVTATAKKLIAVY